MQQVLEKECAAAVPKASSTISRITFFWGLSSKIFRSVVTIHIFFSFFKPKYRKSLFWYIIFDPKKIEKNRPYKITNSLSYHLDILNSSIRQTCKSEITSLFCEYFVIPNSRVLFPGADSTTGKSIGFMICTVGLPLVLSVLSCCSLVVIQSWTDKS